MKVHILAILLSLALWGSFSTAVSPSFAYELSAYDRQAAGLPPPTDLERMAQQSQRDQAQAQRQQQQQERDHNSIKQF
ncbi:MAG TPA: hypothetical protein VLL94_03890, partial [Nitrospiraceae bacterium]|nr:hypothetical protein [Nitrospiraceae bacterium]